MTSQQSDKSDRPATEERPEAQASHRRVAVLATAIALLAVAAAFAAVMRADRTRPPVAGMDRGWLSVVRTMRSAPATDVFKVISLIGGPYGATIIVVLLCAGLVVISRWRTAIYLGLAEALGSTCSDLTKHFVMRLRPPHPLVAADIGSFPSGHVITTIGVGLALTFALTRTGHRRWALTGVAAAGLLMMFCRTYLAAHWLSDTLESLPITFGVGLALWWAFGPFLDRDRDRPARLPSFVPRWGSA